jgi:hypothetical protein
LKSTGEKGLIYPMPKGRESKYDQVTFLGSKGTRDFYKRAAELAGFRDWKDWARVTLHAEATRLHAEHRVKHKPPTVHPVPPPPLQPGARG